MYIHTDGDSQPPAPVSQGISVTRDQGIDESVERHPDNLCRSLLLLGRGQRYWAICRRSRGYARKEVSHGKEEFFLFVGVASYC
jgi:hypothetical protein